MVYSGLEAMVRHGGKAPVADESSRQHQTRHRPYVRKDTCCTCQNHDNLGLA